MKLIQLWLFIRRIVISFSFGIQILVYIFVTIVFLGFSQIWGLIFGILSILFFIFFKINFLPFIIFSIFSIFQFNEKNIKNDFFRRFENKNIEVNGKIINYPSLNSKENQIGKLEIFKINGEIINRGIIISIESFDFKNLFEYFDEIKCFGKVVSQNEAIKSYFLAENLSGKLTCESIKITVTKDIPDVLSNFVKSRRVLLQKINSNLNRPYKDLFLGMLLGSDEHFSDHLKNDINNSGTSHLIAASGFNINLVLAMAFTLSGRIERKKLIILSDFFLLIYLFLVGFDNIPAKRALIMQVYITTAWIFGKKANIFYSLAISCLFMFLENIYVYKSLSFILSFFATLGIAMFYKQTSAFLIKIIKNKWVSELISISFVANIATTPVLILMFGKVSLIGVFVNILISPLVPIVFYLGFVFILLIILGIQSLFVNFIIYSVLDILIKIIDYSGSQSFSTLSINMNPLIIIFIFIIIIGIWLIGFFKKHNNE